MPSGCGCKPSSVSRVRMPDGTIKSYSSSIAAMARVNNTPGAIFLGATTEEQPATPSV